MWATTVLIHFTCALCISGPVLCLLQLYFPVPRPDLLIKAVCLQIRKHNDLPRLTPKSFKRKQVARLTKIFVPELELVFLDRLCDMHVGKNQLIQ